MAVHLSRHREIAFVFVCQQGRLEIESMLLAASLRKHLGNKYELIAAIPAPAEHFGEPDTVTLRVLRNLEVRLEPLENDILRDRSSRDVCYLLTNKIYALRLPTTAKKLIVVDSDQICRDFFAWESLLKMPLCGRQLDYVGGQKIEALWEPLFHAADSLLPHYRTRIFKPRGAMTESIHAPPSFNSSFLAVDVASAVEFSRLWEDCFRRIDQSQVMADAQYYQEEASLAVAAHKSQIAYETLDAALVNPYLTHYFSPQMIEKNQELLSETRDLVRERPGIGRVAAKFPEWRFLTAS